VATAPVTRRLIKPSTRSLLREARAIKGYSFTEFLHGYVYGRWPYLYIGIGLGKYPIARWAAAPLNWLITLVGRTNGRGRKKPGAPSFADTYHGKVLSTDNAVRLVSVQEEIRIPDLERVIPYQRARAIILKNPDHITLLRCPCRAAREHPCEPLDVCLIVGEPFASFIAEHHPDRARRITQAEAIEVLRAEHDRGHVHHAFFKDAMLDRFYAICNCCSCCCGAMQAHRNGTPMLASSGFVSEVNAALCVGCGSCISHCQFHAITLIDGVHHADKDRCLGCGVCVSQCDHGALSLRRDPSRGEPLEIQDLVKKMGRDLN
jgi:ferredoxin